jgi:Transmembrane domain of unknown function (DUF3566)
MSDRTQSSVRTGSRSGDAASKDTPAGEPAASTTQSIPGTGTQRAQGAAGASPVGAPAAGAVPPVQPPSGQQPSVQPPPVQPPSGQQPSVPPAPVAAGAHGGAVPAAATSAPVAGAGAAAVPGVRAGRGRGPSRGGRGPRRARLQLRHIDTWSALKISLVLSIALFFIWMVAVGILYGVLSALGVFDTLNDLFGQVGSVSGSKSSSPVITAGVVFGGAAVIGAINIVLMTALCTVGTFIYNLCSDLVGGLEITLSERD